MSRVEGIGQTSLYIAALRAEESLRKDRICADPYASLLSGSVGNELLLKAKTIDDQCDNLPWVGIRTKWIEDRIKISLDEGVDQVIIIGSGMDSSAWRLGSKGQTFYEIDSETVLSYKTEVMKSIECHCTRVNVPFDVSTPGLKDKLIEIGFDQTKPCIIRMEGVMEYIPRDKADALIKECVSFASPGSMLIGTAMSDSLLRPQAYGVPAEAIEAINKMFTLFKTWGAEYFNGHRDITKELLECNGFLKYEFETSANASFCKPFWRGEKATIDTLVSMWEANPTYNPDNLQNYLWCGWV